MSKVKEILLESFRLDKALQATVKQDDKKEARLKLMIDYSIFMGNKFGKIYLNERENACAIVIYSDRKKTTFSSMRWILKLAFKVVGLKNAFNVFKRAHLIAKFYPDTPYVYIWFIGVEIKDQGKGEGSRLLKNIIEDSQNKPLYLETANERNFTYYEKNGFKKVVNFKEPNGYNLHLYRMLNEKV